MTSPTASPAYITLVPSQSQTILLASSSSSPSSLPTTMAASMAQRSSYCSVAMRKLHRDFERRRKLVVVAKGGVAKKSSAPLPPPRRSAQIPPAPAGAAIKKSSASLPPPPSASISRSPRRERVLATLPPPRSASISRSPRCERVLAPLTPPLPSPNASGWIRKGARVRVRTPAGILPTGQRLVLWLSAVVVSTAEEGYLEVVYNGNFPRDDPFQAVRVARDHVKNMPPAGASAAPAVTTSAAPRPSSAKAAPRPTVAGKSLPVLKRLEKEMQSQSEAILAAW